VKRQAQSLERNLTSIYHQLKDGYSTFGEKCRVFNPTKGYSPATARDIKEKFKEVSAKIAEARHLQQTIRAKYQQHVQIDVQRLREMEDLYSAYRKDYRHFEHTDLEWKQRTRYVGALPDEVRTRMDELYRTRPELPSLLLCFQGDEAAIATVGRRFKLGTRDTSYQEDGTLWVFLAGIQLKEAAVLERKLRATLFKDVEGSVKGVGCPVSNAGGWGDETLETMNQTLQQLEDRVVKIL
jgi:hypothetical protein